MKRLAVFGLALYSSVAVANTCPDLSGLYQMTEGAVLRYQSEDCTRIIRWTGFTTKKGEIVMSPEKQVIYFDGSSVCSGKRCQTTQINDSEILFKLNYDGFVKTREHGLCVHNEYRHTLDAHQDLQATYQVNNCDDGFSGQAVKTFPRVAVPDDL